MSVGSLRAFIAIACKLEQMFFCDSITPFETLVVPEVNKILEDLAIGRKIC